MKDQEERKHQMICTQLHETEQLKISGLNKENVYFLHVMRSLALFRKSNPGEGIQKNCEGPGLFLSLFFTKHSLQITVKMGTRWFFYVQALCSPSTRRKWKGKNCGVYFIFAWIIIAFVEVLPSRCLLTSHWLDLDQLFISNCKGVWERYLSATLDKIWVLLVKKGFCLWRGAWHTS